MLLGGAPSAIEVGLRALISQEEGQPPVHLNLDLRDNVHIFSFFMNIRHCGF